MAYAPLCLFFLLTLVARSFQQFPEPIHDFCRRWDHQTAIIDSKLYIDGGMVAYNNRKSNYTSMQSTDVSAPIRDSSLSKADEYLLVSDLNTPRTGKDSPTQAANLTKRTTVPLVSGGYLWADETNRCFYQVAGEVTSGPMREFSLWTYDVILDQWNNTNLNGADKSLQRVSYGAGAQDDSLGQGFYYGGWLNNRTTPGWTGPPLATNGMLVFDYTSREIRNLSTADSVGRAEGQMVFVPVSDTGMLIYFGGIEDPYHNGSYVASNMSNVRIFDIDSERWYNQTTTGDIPLPRRRFCAGITWANDRSSFNIYLFGGYGFGEALAFNDVYILSIPSFKWVKAWPLPEESTQYEYPNPQGHGGCSANVVRRDQMIVIGGWFPHPRSEECDSAGSQGQHNMILGNNSDAHKIWDNYDPKLSTYEVPSQVIVAIGGGPTGGATVTAPATWGHADLPKLYKIRPTPSPRTATRSLPSPTSSPFPTASPKKPDIGAIAGGVVGGLVGLLLFLCLILFCLHRRKNAGKRKKDAPSTPSELANTPAACEIGPNNHELPYRQHSNYSSTAPLQPQAASYEHSPQMAPSHTFAPPRQAVTYQPPNEGYVHHSPPPHTEMFFPEDRSTRNSPPTPWEHNTYSPQSTGAPESYYLYPTPTSPLQYSAVSVQPPQDPRAPSQHPRIFSETPDGTRNGGEMSYVTSTMTTPAHFYAQPTSGGSPRLK